MMSRLQRKQSLCEDREHLFQLKCFYKNVYLKKIYNHPAKLKFLNKNNDYELQKMPNSKYFIIFDFKINLSYSCTELLKEIPAKATYKLAKFHYWYRLNNYDNECYALELL